jgi:hypothetical protein
MLTEASLNKIIRDMELDRAEEFWSLAEKVRTEGDTAWNRHWVGVYEDQMWAWLFAWAGASESLL